MKLMGLSLAAFSAILLLSGGMLVHAETPPQTLFVNVHVFDGVSEKRLENASVLVEGNLIKKVSRDSIKASGAKVIDGGGRTLMPGLLDSHVHLMINDAPHISIYEKPWAYVGAQAVAGAEAMLLRGFTTVRDIGGPVAGLKDAIMRTPIRRCVCV